MLESIDHIHVSIPPGAEAEAQAREFYRDFLGLREIPKPDGLRQRGGMWLQLGALQIHLGVEEGVDRARTKAHVAYRVREIESWRGRLEARGIEVREGSPIPGVARFEFRDPFGNRVEFMEKRES